MRGSCQSMTASPREHNHAGRTPDLRRGQRVTGSMHALRQAAGLARQHDAVLVPLLARAPPGGNPNESATTSALSAPAVGRPGLAAAGAHPRHRPPGGSIRRREDS